ncbi:MAG: helix-turn-helix domain-containing protein [Elusimicrobiota bacterium]|nr:helix-turn-helix domain-containing protein [Elusimicrobiota bacterium]
MNLSLKKFKDFYLEHLLALLWRKWSALGVTGYGDNVESGLIDPEVLLLLSCTVARYDPRLFDAIMDWLNINGGLINIRRLKKIINSYAFQGADILSAVAAFMEQKHKFLKWKGLIRRQDTESRESLFFLKDGSSMKQFGKSEPVFFKHGYLRGKIKLRKNLSPIKTGNNNCLIVKLRFLFGINARSEILLYLLAKGKAHPSEIARKIYYSQKTVQDTLVEMEHSGLVRLTMAGREKHYWLNNEKWSAFLMLDEPLTGYINQPLFFYALEKLWLKLNQKNFCNFNSETQASELRELMREIRPKIEEAGFRGILSDDQPYLGESYLSVFQSDIKKLITTGEPLHAATKSA